jgi:hypothetical protein
MVIIGLSNCGICDNAKEKYPEAEFVNLTELVNSDKEKALEISRCIRTLIGKNSVEFPIIIMEGDECGAA